MMPAQQLKMKAFRNTAQRILSSRRSSPLEERNLDRHHLETVPPWHEDRANRRDAVTMMVTEGVVRIPDQPRAQPATLRPPASSPSVTESMEDDGDYSMQPNSSSISNRRSIGSDDENSSSGTGKEAAHELALRLGEIDRSAERALLLVGAFAFGTINPSERLARQGALDEAGALQKLIDVLGEYIGHIGVVALVLCIFGGLRIDEGVGLRVGMIGTVGSVVATLRIYRGDGRVVRDGLRVLCALTRLNDVRTNLLSRYGAIEAVIECLQRHVGNEAVQTEGARFVSYASMHSETNKTELATGDGLGRVLKAARDFRESRTLCTNVCIGLRNVTVRRPDIVKAVLGLDGVDGLLEILSGHGGARTTATHVLAGLYHMIGCEAGIREVLQHEGWEVVLIESGRRHKSCANVQALCLAIMGRVAVAGGPRAARGLVKCGAIKMAMAGMHQFINRRAVVYLGARLLRVLSEQGGVEDVRSFCGVDELLDLFCFTVVTSGLGEERYSGYADVFNES